MIKSRLCLGIRAQFVEMENVINPLILVYSLQAHNLKQRWINIDSTSWRCINLDSLLVSALCTLCSLLSHRYDMSNVSNLICIASIKATVLECLVLNANGKIVVRPTGPTTDVCHPFSSPFWLCWENILHGVVFFSHRLRQTFKEMWQASSHIIYQ